MCGKVTAAIEKRANKREMKMPTDTDLISKVRDVLLDSAKAGKTITFSEIEKRVGDAIAAWKKVLDPIYEDCMAHEHPDLTAIVIYNATGYPPFLNEGGDARSKRFNPNNLQASRTVAKRGVSRFRVVYEGAIVLRASRSG